LRADGLIAISGRNVALLDRDALELLAQFQPLSLTPIPPADN
jgi:hypothetical protein